MSLKAHPNIGQWLATEDGKLLVKSGKVDIGQRISTALLQIAHEELTLPYDSIALAPVRTGPSPDEGMTSGSNSLEQSGHAVRCASATLRRLLLEHAAARHGGAPEDWTLSDGALTRPGQNRPLDVLALLGEIDLDQPADPEAVTLGDRDALPAPPMRGMEELVTGRYRFVHDIELPDMWHARVVRPPHALATLATIPEDRVARLEERGMQLIRDGSFMAVAGPDEWAVQRTATGLATACEWDTGEGLPEDDVFERLTTDNATRLPVVDSTPVKDGEIPPAPQADVTARYERPFTLHGALAPSAALAVWQDDSLDIQTHSQGIYPLRGAIAESLGLEPKQVTLTHLPGSGCYGHNGADDAAFEAALVARALPGTPILLKWTRDDEHAWEPVGTAMAVDLAAKLGEDGRISAWSAEAISGTHRGRPRSGPNKAGPAKLLANRFRAEPIPPQVPGPNMNRHGGMHRNLDPVYDFAEKRLVKNLITDMPLRTSALRCLGAVTNVFGIESFLDELAWDRAEDPIALRRAMLSDDRAIAVLDRLEDHLSTLPAPAEGEGRGIAYAQYKNEMTRVGVCVDIAVTDLAEIRLKRAVLVADAGRIVDRDGLTAQIEGGFVQGASWALHEQVAWDRDGIATRDWESYPVLRFDNIPEIEVILIDRPTQPPRGAGEAAPGPTVAAIANGLHAATGLRLRRLPLTPEAILQAAASD